MKDIALAKRNEYQKLDTEYQQMVLKNKPQLDSSQAGLKNIEQQIKNSEEDFLKYLNDGFLTRIAALEHLLKDNTALQYRYYLIVFILMLIELMPVIAKTMLPSGSYDEKAMKREEMEIALAQSNIEKEKQLKELYNQAAYDNDADAIKDFFQLTQKDRIEKMRSLSEEWKGQEDYSFDKLWEKIKKDVLTKQEN